MKVAVIGSREWDDADILFTYLDKLLKRHPTLHVVTGGAQGADWYAEVWAELIRCVPCTVYRPEYHLFADNRQAPLERNKKIVDDSEWCVGFWDGKSGGTAQALSYAAKQGKKAWVIRPDGTHHPWKRT